jgi:hypothetical protein
VDNGRNAKMRSPLKCIDYRIEKTEKSWRVERRHLCDQIGLDSLKNPEHHPKKTESFISQEMHLKKPLLSLGFEIVKF